MNTNDSIQQLNNIAVFSIDPSIRACGWALLINGRIIAGLKQTKSTLKPSSAILQIYRFLYTICPPELTYLVVERPILVPVWTKEKKENVAKLLAAYDTYIKLGDKLTKKWTPTVSEWKGQQSKEICWTRCNETLKDNNISYEIRPNIPPSLMHNVYDAIALLVRFLQKERFID